MPLRRELIQNFKLDQFNDRIVLLVPCNGCYCKWASSKSFFCSKLHTDESNIINTIQNDPFIWPPLCNVSTDNESYWKKSAGISYAHIYARTKVSWIRTSSSDLNLTVLKQTLKPRKGTNFRKLRLFLLFIINDFGKATTPDTGKWFLECCLKIINNRNE